MVNVIGNGHGDPGEDVCISHGANALRKDMNHISLPLWQQVKEKENFSFNPDEHHIKLTLCHILLVWRGW